MGGTPVTMVLVTTPRTGRSPNCVSVPTEPPSFVRGVVIHKGEAGTETVLRREAANSSVERIFSRQRYRAGADFAELSAVLFDVHSLAAHIRSELALLSKCGRGDDK